MLAALIATRHAPIPIIVYGNRLVAAITTFTCLTIARRAGQITTDGLAAQQIFFSSSGSESIFDHLSRDYSILIGQDVIDRPALLSSVIADIIPVVTTLNGLVQSLNTAAQNASTLAKMQEQLPIALAVLNSLILSITYVS